jgi:hypothetical protein
MASLKVKRPFSDTLCNTNNSEQQAQPPSPSTCTAFRLQSLDGTPTQQSKRLRGATPDAAAANASTSSSNTALHASLSPTFPRPNTPFAALGTQPILGLNFGFSLSTISRKHSTNTIDFFIILHHHLNHTLYSHRVECFLLLKILFHNRIRCFFQNFENDRWQQFVDNQFRSSSAEYHLNSVVFRFFNQL